MSKDAEKKPHKEDGRQTRTVLSVMVIMLSGKVAGLFREILLARQYGTGNVMSEAFNYAYQFPATFLDVVFASAFTASFIPVFSGYMEKKGREAAFRLTNAFVTLTLLLTTVVTLILVGFSPLVINLLLRSNANPDFVSEASALATPLLRIMLPTIVLSGAAYSVTGILQAMDEFNAPAAMSLMSNAIIIIYLLFFIDIFGIYGLAVVFVVAWGAQVLIQLPALRKKGFRFKPSFHFREPGLKEIGRLMLPVMVSTWALPINLMVNGAVAARVAGGSALTRANTIYSVITGVFVMSITNVLFTKFSKLSSSGMNEELKDSVSSSVKGMLFILLPMSAGVFILAPRIIELLFMGGVFGGESAKATGEALRYLAPGMCGYGLHSILCRVYYSLKKGLTPLFASLAAIAVNAVLSFTLVDKLGTGGPALASSVSITVACVILGLGLVRLRVLRLGKGFGGDAGRMAFLSVTMAVAAAMFYDMLSGFLPQGGKLLLGVSLILTVIIGALWYFAGAYYLGVSEARGIPALIRGVLRRKGHD